MDNETKEENIIKKIRDEYIQATISEYGIGMSPLLHQKISDLNHRLNKLEKSLNILNVFISLGLFVAFLEIGYIAHWI